MLRHVWMVWHGMRRRLPALGCPYYFSAKDFVATRHEVLFPCTSHVVDTWPSLVVHNTIVCFTV